jgi:hypothetical protein
MVALRTPPRGASRGVARVGPCHSAGRGSRPGGRDTHCRRPRNRFRSSSRSRSTRRRRRPSHAQDRRCRASLRRKPAPGAHGCARSQARTRPPVLRPVQAPMRWRGTRRLRPPPSQAPRRRSPASTGPGPDICRGAPGGCAATRGSRPNAVGRPLAEDRDLRMLERPGRALRMRFPGQARMRSAGPHKTGPRHCPLPRGPHALSGRGLGFRRPRGRTGRGSVLRHGSPERALLRL